MIIIEQLFNCQVCGLLLFTFLYTVEQLFNYVIIMQRGIYMESKKADCDATNIDIVNKVKPNMPEIGMLYDLSEFFKVMGDSTRIQLLWALEESEMCVGDLAVLLNMTKSAVSHQLKVLRTAKLVRSRKKGKNVYYALDDHHVKMILEKALEHVCE